MNYREYLKSPQWQKIRERKIRQSGCRCEHCGSSGPFQVHHVTYRNLGHENDAELMALCGRCHEAIEAVIQTGKHTRRGQLKGLRRYTHNRLIELGIPRRSDANPCRPHRPKKNLDIQSVVSLFHQQKTVRL